MTPILILIQPFDTDLGARVAIRVADAGEADAYGLGGQPWKPGITERPVISMETMSIDLDGKVIAGQARASLNLNELGVSNGGKLKWEGAPVTIYSSVDLKWPASIEFEGYVTDRALDIENATVSLSMQVSTDFLEGPLLIGEFSGGGGLNGDADKRGVKLPAGFGLVENIEPVWFDSTRWIGMIDGYANTVSITRLTEGLNDFGASQGNYANYAALAAAVDAHDIKPGEWATCVGSGLVALGAPPEGPIGVTATFGTNRVGALMKRILQQHRGVPIGSIDVAAFDALDAAVPRDVHFWTDSQRDVKDLLEALAGSANATPLVTIQKKVTVSRGVASAPVATLDRSGGIEPRVVDWKTASAVKPMWRMKARAARPAKVLTYDQVNYKDTIEDKGLFNATETYRPGHVVWLDNKSSWLYINDTPTSGNTPPVWPIESNAFWQNMTPPLTAVNVLYADGTPIEDLQPAEGGATNDGDRRVANILTIDEKIRIVIPKENARSGVNGRYPTVRARMVALGLSVTALDAASADWLAYRNSIADWDNAAVNSNIVRATWDSLDKAFDDQLSLADVAIGHQTNTHFPEMLPDTPPIGVEYIDADGLRFRYGGLFLLVDGEPLTFGDDPFLGPEWLDLQDLDITQARYQVSVIPPAKQIIYCGEDGGVLPNQFPPRVLTPIVMMGTEDIRTRADVNYSLEPDSSVNVVATINNEFDSPDKGRITVTSGNPGFLLLTIRVDVREYGPYKISFERQIAPASTSGGTGSKFAESSTLDTVNSTSYSRMAGPLTVTVGTGEDAICTAPLTYSLGASVTSNAALIARWRRSVAGADDWDDLGSPIIGTTSYWYQDDFSGEIGAGDFNFIDAEPTPDNYDYELWGAMTNDPDNGFIEVFSGTAKIQVQ